MKNIIIGEMTTRRIWIDDIFLHPLESQRAYNHSPDGFNWGYGGSGPAQLALAILLKFTDKKTALRLHQEFKWDVIAKLPQKDFEINIDIKKWIREFKRKILNEGTSN